MASAINPFTSSSRSPFDLSVPEGAQENEGASYVLVRQGPPVASAEVESAHAEAIEVSLAWGTNILSVSHLSPPRSFSIGEHGECLLPADLLGVDTMSLLEVNLGEVRLNVPRGATGTIAKAGEATQSIALLLAERNGPRDIKLAPGAEVTVRLLGSELEFSIRVVPAGKRLALDRLAWVASAVTGAIGISLLGHMGTVGVMALVAPHMADDDADAISRENILYMQKMLNASAENERLREETPEGLSGSPEAGQPGAAARGEAGKAGSLVSQNTNGRFGVKGESKDPHLARMEDMRIAQEEGLVGLLKSDLARNPHAPTSPWGADTAEGSDDSNAVGNMFGSTIADAQGNGGLALSGTGESGGGPGSGIGLNGISGLGNCLSLPCGRGPGGQGPGGIGQGGSPLRGGHSPNFHMPRAEKTEFNGSIPADVIQRIVRLNFGRFRNCYETGLRTNPSLAGRVAAKFVIDRSGAVSMSRDGGSDLPDQAVVACVVNSFQTLSFPNPQGGQVTVTYPLVFSPEQ